MIRENGNYLRQDHASKQEITGLKPIYLNASSSIESARRPTPNIVIDTHEGDTRAKGVIAADAVKVNWERLLRRFAATTLPVAITPMEQGAS
jgi:hypothetical protein